MKVSTDGCLFGALTQVEECRRVLDIGAGTGLLTLMAAQRSEADIDAVELDQQAARQAGENFRASPWSNRLTIHCASIQDYARQSISTYDLIICNPPFFTRHLASTNSQRHHARHNDSLSFEELLACVCKLLSREGSFEVLLPTSESERFLGLAHGCGLYCNRSIGVQATENKPVSRNILKLSFIDNPEPEHQLVIQDGVGYSAEFQEILKPYYLFL